MMTAYIISAIVGGAFVLVGALTGHDHDAGGGDLDHGGDMGGEVGGDADVDHSAEVGSGGEVGHEADSEADAHAEVWLPFLSFRFWTFAAAFFGVTGLLLSWLSPLGAIGTALVAGGTGTTAGLSVSYVTRYLKLSQSTSGAGVRDLIGTEARVLLPIGPGAPGKVRLSVKGDTIDLIAETEEPDTLEVGAEVVIIQLHETRARVVRSTALAGTGTATKRLPEKTG